MFARLLGEDHPWVADGLMNRAQVWSRLNRPEDAKALVGRAIEIRRRVFGDESGAVAQALSWLGFFYRQTGPIDSAVAIGKRAASTAEAAFGATRNTADHITTYGRSLLAAEDYAGAAAELDRAIGIYRALETRNGIMGTALFDRGRLFARTGALSEAAELMGEALALRRDFFGDSAVVVIRTADSLAAVFRALGRSTAVDSVRAIVARPRD
jgi:tetratricopeptide (TPR) repeat protein